jgi:predicted negative regulator of RcsB-dependent stress response
MAKKPLNRKKLLKEPDEFITTMGRLIRFGTRYQRQIIYGVIALFVVLAAASGYRYYRYTTNSNAFGLLSQANSAYAQQLQTSDSDPAKAYENVKGDYEALFNSYDGTSAAKIGRIIFANIALRANEPDQAMTLYQAALDDFEGSSFYGPMVRANLGKTLLAKNDLDDALVQFEQAATGEPAPLIAEALFHAAVITQAQNNSDEAAALFDKIVTDYPASAYAPLAREATRG